MTALPTLARVLDAIVAFTFLYPLTMAYVWMAGAIVFHLRHERGGPRDAATSAPRWPRVSVLVPCFNEADNVVSVIVPLDSLDYPDYEVIAINDGSSDATGELLDALAHRIPRLRVIHQASNQGKAVGLSTAAMAATGEILVGIDGDAVLDPDAVRWLVRHFVADPRVGAVTGNPRIRTRSTVLGRLQVAEFSSVVGLIKRAQGALTGRLFTVSGVVAAFRRSAVAGVGFWSNDMLTEDIDISWKLQCAGWTIRFEPRALVWILMPETLRGLWKQRLRWAMGGVQVIAKFRGVLAHTSQWRMWPVYAEYLASLVWAYLMALTLLAGAAAALARAAGQPSWLPDAVHQVTLFPGWAGTFIAATCVLQFALSLALDARYDVRLVRHMSATIWYPLAFWMLGMATSVWAVPRCLARARGQRAVWTSPDRGIQSSSPPEQRP